MSHPRARPAWLLLVHQLPARPTSLRVKTWRRLHDVGAVALKNSVYVLPNSDQSREDLEWIKTEIQGMRGEAVVLAADSIDAFTNDEVVAAFQQARAPDYAALARDATALAALLDRRGTATARTELARRVGRLQHRLAALDAIAFFPPAGRTAAAAGVARLAQLVDGQHPVQRDGSPGTLDVSRFHKRVWVTRPRPGIDRLSSAWLIRRFIDPKARFAFADKPPSAGTAIPFDMFGVEFSHTRHGCTFETFVARFGLSSMAVDRIAQIVHDLDLKEARYSPPEAPALAHLVEGLGAMYADDQALINQGIVIFEALYRSFSTPDRVRTTPGRRHRAGRRRGGA